MKAEGLSTVSRTMRRRLAFNRSRRGRIVGKPAILPAGVRSTSCSPWMRIIAIRLLHCLLEIAHEGSDQPSKGMFVRNYRNLQTCLARGARRARPNARQADLTQGCDGTACCGEAFHQVVRR